MPEVYTVEVDGQQFLVKVSQGGDIQSTTPVDSKRTAPVAATRIAAPLAGTIFKVLVEPGDLLASGDVVLVLEAMKMETEIRTSNAGTVSEILVSEGDAVKAGDALVTLV